VEPMLRRGANDAPEQTPEGPTGVLELEAEGNSGLPRKRWRPSALSVEPECPQSDFARLRANCPPTRGDRRRVWRATSANITVCGSIRALDCCGRGAPPPTRSFGLCCGGVLVLAHGATSGRRAPFPTNYFSHAAPFPRPMPSVTLPSIDSVRIGHRPSRYGQPLSTFSTLEQIFVPRHSPVTKSSTVSKSRISTQPHASWNPLISSCGLNSRSPAGRYDRSHARQKAKRRPRTG